MPTLLLFLFTLFPPCRLPKPGKFKTKQTMTRLMLLHTVSKFIPVTLTLMFFVNTIALLVAGTSFCATKILTITPIQVIFTDRQRTVPVSVINQSDQSITYAISLATYRKDTDGGYHKAIEETRDEELTRSMIRFSPRRATIGPGERQLVKLMVRKPADLPVGEYHTWLVLTPLRNSENQKDSGAIPTQGQSIDLSIVVTSVFPVFIQHGDIFGDIKPQALRFIESPESPSGKAAEITLSRSGEGAAFGTVVLYHTPKWGRKKTTIALAQKLSMFIPETERTQTIPLRNITGLDLTSGTVEVVYIPTTGVPRERLPRRLVNRSKKFSLPLN